MKIGVSEHDQDSAINVKDKGEYVEVQLIDCEEEIYWKFPKSPKGVRKASNCLACFRALHDDLWDAVMDDCIDSHR